MEAFECQLCGASYFGKYAKPSTCRSRSAILTYTCWSGSTDPFLRACQASQPGIFKTRSKRMVELLGGMGRAHIENGTAGVDAYLTSITADDRCLLIEKANKELQIFLSERFARLQCDVARNFNVVEVPEDITGTLRESVEGYLVKNQKRLELLHSRGHHRSLMYLRRKMVSTFAFVRFIQGRGITSLDNVSQFDLIDFAATTRPAQMVEVSAFLKSQSTRFALADKQKRGMKTKSQTRIKQAPPVTLQEEEVEQFFSQLKTINDDEIYLMAWLVGRVGVRLSKVLELNLSQVEIQSGAVVIQPHKAWLSLPKTISERFLRVTPAVAPNFQLMTPESRRLLPVFSQRAQKLVGHNGGLKINAKALRNYALVKSMRAGITDRVTLVASTGASAAHIARLETLVSCDIHFKIDPELVKARNKKILETE